MQERRNHEPGAKGPKAFFPEPPEWRELGGTESMRRRISSFLVVPRIVAFSLISEEIIARLGLPRPSSMQPLRERGHLGELIENNFVRIHRSSWLNYSREKGWGSKGLAPKMVSLVNRPFPPRLTIYGLERLSRRSIVCSFRPSRLRELSMGRLGIHLRAKQELVFIGEDATDERVQITLLRTATKRSLRMLEREPEVFSPFIEAARDFISNQEEFGLDVWFPWQSDSGEMQSAKLFGALFRGITLREIMEGENDS